jgi:hypothetical protein
VAIPDSSGVQPDSGRAIGRKGIVKGRAIAQLIDRFQVIEKNPPKIFKRSVDPVYIYVLLRLAIIGSHPDDVALIGDHVSGFGPLRGFSVLLP